jgi:putative glycerol-1-phosphate prenyltransferase/phosphoglycerol geranylgeranyltransferase
MPSSFASIKLGPIESQLLETIHLRKALFIVLLDPGAESSEDIIASGVSAARAGADCLLIGGSYINNPDFENVSRSLKQEASIPLILFPGAASQVTLGPDAILFTSLISGRNANYLIEEQVQGAPLVKSYQIEPIPTAYMLIESGKATAVEEVSQTKPIPANEPHTTVDHALAAEMMGQRWIYLEAGSGAERPVPVEMITETRKSSKLNLIVGGGIRTPESAAERVAAGAHGIVVGNLFEKKKDPTLFQAFSEAIHT